MAAGKTRKKLNAKASRGSGGGGGGDMQKIYYDPLGFETSVLFTVQEISVETAQLSLSSPGTFQFTLEGQKVKIESGTTTLPTGIGHIITTVTLSDALVYGYSQVAQAYVTALGVYVPCTYDVATNVAKFDYLLWAGRISQSGTSAPTIDATSYNISGETPTLGYVSNGTYSITFTSNKLVTADATKHFSFVYDGEAQGFYTIEGTSNTDAVIKCFRSGAFADDRLDNSYIEIRLVYTL